MCIIAREVESVGSTKIFVAPDSKREYQLTVYSNLIENETDNNAMILPVPNPNTVTFMEIYPSFFNDCSDCFKIDHGRSKSFDDGARSCRETLEVHRVGGYLASIAKSLDEIKQADKSVFDIPEDCIKVLNGYPSSYGFIICKLEKDKKEYHPFAYSHAMYYDILFIPTKHYHAIKQKPNEKEGIQATRIRTGEIKMLFPEMHLSEGEVFDHDIYIYNGIGIESHFDKSLKYKFKSHKLSKITNNLSFELGPCKTFKKYQIKGFFKNIDLTANIIYARIGPIPAFSKEKVNESDEGNPCLIKVKYVDENPSSIKNKSKSNYCCIN